MLYRIQTRWTNKFIHMIARDVLNSSVPRLGKNMELQRDGSGFYLKLGYLSYLCANLPMFWQE